MTVLFLTRTSIDQLSGGDKIQILKTKGALESLDVTVRLSSGRVRDLTDIDVVHLFNPSQVSAEVLRQLKLHRLPLVVSTIHWDMREYYQAMFSVNREYLKLKPPHFLQYYLTSQFRAALYHYAWDPYVKRRLQTMFRFADLLLPNSVAEARLIERDFGIPANRFSVVVNGFDPLLARQAAPGRFAPRHRLKDFILCVGRIEYRKNQLALIQALMDFPAPLVFIGKAFDPGYTALCKKLGQKRGKTLFIDHLEQRELYDAYADAKVHALVSWYETPGLASLEAGALGKNLVVSRRGCTEEYFGTLAEYCEPNRGQSIRTAIERAWAKGKATALQQHIAERFTWSRAGAQTLAAYQRAQSS